MWTREPARDPPVTPLFDTWTSVGSLWDAARRAARGKRLRPSVARTLLDLEGTVLTLHRALRDGSWRPGIPSKHLIRDGKTRLISAAPFPDRIVHQALCASIRPLLDRHLIDRTFACRVGLGTHAAVRQARLWAHHYPFALHLDVAKFFPSIDHVLLMAQLEHDVPCPLTLDVCGHILEAGSERVAPVQRHFPGDDLFSPHARAVGVPIGNLTSQHFANRFLSPVDHRMTDRLRIRPYLRYMDDMLLFGNDRAQLTDWGHALEEACLRQRLRLHRWEVVPTRAGVGWLGFRILPHCVRVKRSSVVRAQKNLEERNRVPGGQDKFLSSLRSVFAHWKHANTYRLRTQTLRKLGWLAGDENS